MQDFFSHIAFLLTFYKRVTIPYFGSFEVCPAAIKEAGSPLCLPVGNSLQFDDEFTHNDGGLVHYLATVDGVLDYEAEKKVQQFVETMKKGLNGNMAVRMPRIGKLTLSATNKITLEPAPAEELSCNAGLYGLSNLQMKKLLPKEEKPVVNEVEIPDYSSEFAAEATLADTAEEKPVVKKRTKKKKKKKMPLGSVIVILILSLLFAVLFCAPMFIPLEGDEPVQTVDELLSFWNRQLHYAWAEINGLLAPENSPEVIETVPERTVPEVIDTIPKEIVPEDTIPEDTIPKN
ncbi:hypothetical protein AGMMS49982_14580 [Bacteroidia bacterium]|nr:hypothetical protein AGMMS49982_14580 [Bacteroidia bacterium]